MEYTLILIAVLVFSPFILSLASSQEKAVKRNLRNLFLSILSLQIMLGFFNWENFSVSGRDGFELALAYPASLLALFFGMSLLQIILLMTNKSFSRLAVVLNFINSGLIFVGMIRLSNILELQAASFSSIGAVFLVLMGNVTGLAFINKDKNILKKYQFLK